MKEGKDDYAVVRLIAEGDIESDFSVTVLANNGSAIGECIYVYCKLYNTYLNYIRIYMFYVRWYILTHLCTYIVIYHHSFMLSAACACR